MGFRTLAAVLVGLIAFTGACGRRGDPRGFPAVREPTLRIRDAGRTPDGLQWHGGPGAVRVEWLPLADWRCPGPRTAPHTATVTAVSGAPEWRRTPLPITGPVAWRVAAQHISSAWMIAGPSPAPRETTMIVETAQGRIRLQSAPPTTMATVLIQLREDGRWSAPRPVRLPVTLGPWPPDTRIGLRWTLIEEADGRWFYPGTWHVRTMTIP